MSITMQTGTPAAIPSFAMRVLALCYGGLAYLIFLGTFLYAVGFVSQLVVPKTINTGPAASLPTALLINLVLMSIFAVQHSGMARQGFKRLFARFASPAIERSTYVLLASLSLILLFWQWQPMPAVVWNIEGPVFAGVVTAIGFMGWLIVLYSTFLISHFELFGLTQVVAHFAGRLTAPIAFRTPGLYRLIRHPIYLGFIIAFWSTPVMTLGHLLFASVTTAYIFVGIWLEERDLVAFFGDEYRKYRERVAMLLPGLF
ncbi:MULTISPECIES: methanethiol S-methyltransferase [unclassified Bradyrhizobium]|uniref:methanethiol S-methyltransferase n=1 Tax=unclassified Bradyrhizobium TaxID=2631580 RepID=UPI001BABD000|nr:MULTISPECIES: methanethiol S-methyltransferase [unclassified Bradyrhizobium]MBR1229335.1 isoprenylcysteine carboxylmethyltransferase family protein [Bradyrhizobium sp. AUGA SZCCT0176]MBR1300990.1 isoprenylcysteine carboxylmethyltransferase family protein [Bradyrhizobium sp. AUGA SZCCT0042]